MAGVTVLVDNLPYRMERVALAEQHRLRNILKRVISGAGPLRGHATTAVIAIVCSGAVWLALGVPWRALDPGAQPRAEQRMTVMSRAEVASQWETDYAERTTWCYRAAVCQKYGIVRQACESHAAPADCIRERMGRDVKLLPLCGDDGRLRNMPPDIPDSVTCLYFRYTD